ncbi:MAG: polyprenyl synthetase family protein [Rickettsiales bacterium]|nr:MAG: polyprenyl synthetase family protein [Rickettsiales bacterium]
MDLIKEIHHYLADELKAINNIIIDSLAVEEELISIVSNHLSNAGGKRIRPILTILCAKMFEYKGDSAIKLAAAIEFIHMATLLHDDVVDGSKMRRFLPTANTVWGSKASILVGDFLFSQSFKLIVSTKLQSCLEVLSSASAIIAEGEVAQLTKLEQQKIMSQEEYFKVINAKTAELFSASCVVGAIVSGREDAEKFLKEFGLLLGNVFQIADDALDYFSNSSKVGKNIGDDFYEGKVTLPLIYLSQNLIQEDQQKLNMMIAADDRSISDFEWVKDKMVEFAIPTLIMNQIDEIKMKASNILEKIENINNEPKEYLQKLLEFAAKRTY